MMQTWRDYTAAIYEHNGWGSLLRQLAIIALISMTIVSLICISVRCVEAAHPDTTRGEHWTQVQDEGTGVFTTRRQMNYLDAASGKYMARGGLIHDHESTTHEDCDIEDCGHEDFKHTSDMNLHINTHAGSFETSFGADSIKITPQYATHGRADKSFDRVQFRNQWTSTDFDIALGAGAAQMELHLLTKDAPVTFNFLVEFSGVPIRERGGIRVGRAKLTSPEAWSKTTEKLPVDFGYLYVDDHTRNMWLTVDTSGAVWPIRVDPVIRDTIRTYTDGIRMYSHHADFATARGVVAATAVDTTATRLGVGPQFAGIYYIRRSTMIFDMSSYPDGVVTDSVFVSITSINDNSTTDFTWNFISSRAVGGVAADWSAFPDHESGATPYDTPRMIDSVYTSTGFVAGTEYTYKLTAAGVDTFDAHETAGGKFKLHALSEKDIKGESNFPTDNSRVEWYLAGTASRDPHVTAYYHVLPTARPTGVAFTLLNGAEATLDSVEGGGVAELYTIKYLNANKYLSPNGFFYASADCTFANTKDLHLNLDFGFGTNTMHYFRVTESTESDSTAIDSFETGVAGGGGGGGSLIVMNIDTGLKDTLDLSRLALVYDSDSHATMGGTDTDTLLMTVSGVAASNSDSLGSLIATAYLQKAQYADSLQAHLQQGAVIRRIGTRIH